MNTFVDTKECGQSHMQLRLNALLSYEKYIKMVSIYYFFSLP